VIGLLEVTLDVAYLALLVAGIVWSQAGFLRNLKPTIVSERQKAARRRARVGAVGVRAQEEGDDAASPRAVRSSSKLECSCRPSDTFRDTQHRRHPVRIADRLG
jgi:hypothetical protein